jgi:N-acetylglucosaminyldiphosphoundecaprenol N-acetyl-beta-D-mannosaminyltransferase
MTTDDGQRRLLFGLRLDALTMAQVVQRCESAIADRSRTLIGVVNAAKVVKLRADPALRDSLLECDVLVADGQSVVWASRLLGRPLPERVAGIDLFEQLLIVAAKKQMRVYLMGATQTVIDTLVDELPRRFPGLVLAGARDGYFPVEESAVVAKDIAESNADMLFLGMTSPKKEIFLGTYGDDLNVPVLHGVGGSFDIFAGLTKRAPVRWQRLGLEWLYRLLQEPRRLFKRYATTNSAFAWLTFRERIRPTPEYRVSVRRG